MSDDEDYFPTVIYVSPEAYDELLAMLEEPPKVSEKLRRLMDRKAPWDTEGDT